MPILARGIHLTSLGELRAEAATWDDLWRRSDITSPTLRAGLIGHWVQHFASRRAPQNAMHGFRALVVEQGGCWVAGLPLVAGRAAGVLNVGTWPANEWSDSGDLLLDPAVEPSPVLDVLAQALSRLPWPLLRLADVPINADRWKHAVAAFERAGMPLHFRPEMQPGRIDTRGGWEAYRRRWSRRHRQQVERHLRQLAQRGHTELRLLDQLTPDEVEPWLSAGFEIEDRSWKGAHATSVLRSPGLFSFYLGQARKLARHGELVLAMLMLDDRPVAFAYGMRAKGVYRSYKVGYDPEFAQYGPGQLLRYRLLERFFHDDQYRAVEYITPSPAHNRWRPEPYQIGRLLVARRTWFGRCLVGASQLVPAQRAKPAGLSSMDGTSK